MTPYIKRIATDWMKTHSEPKLVGSCYDPLLIIEVIVESNPQWGWLIISAIMDIDEDGISFPAFIAGPLESWVSKHASTWIDFIESEARTNDRFKWALGALVQGHLSDAIWHRIEAARGTPWLKGEFPKVPPK